MTKYHITPEEGADLACHMTVADSNMGWDIKNSYVKHNDYPGADLLAYGACFYAGVVEGVRRERGTPRAAEEEENVYTRFVCSMMHDIKDDMVLRRIYNLARYLWMKEDQT